MLGWADIAELIKRLVSPKRVREQLSPIIHLAECFVNVACVEGSKAVGDSVASSIAKITKSEFAKMKEDDVESYITFLVSYEVDPSTINQAKLALFASLFRELDLESRGTSRMTSRRILPKDVPGIVEVLGGNLTSFGNLLLRRNWGNLQ